MIREKDYSPFKKYRLCTKEEYDSNFDIQLKWCDPTSITNMNFLFGVDIPNEIVERILKHVMKLIVGNFYNLNPNHPCANNERWSLFDVFIFEKSDKPEKLISIPEY